jgi:hypothetical protein
MTQFVTSDIEMPLQEIAGNRKFMEIFASQLSVRMNSTKHYSEQAVASALGDLAD